jgi:hypothetical protein
MNASDRIPQAGDDQRPPSGGALRPDEPMSDELCVFVLSLHADGRPLPAALLERARAWASAHPACRAALADFAAIGAILRSEPAPVARPGFVRRVLAARAAEAAGRGPALVLARRMAVAAALLLGLTVAAEIVLPRPAVADPDVTVERHAVDAFRPEPFQPDDLERGILTLLPDPARRSSGRVRSEAAATKEAGR